MISKYFVQYNHQISTMKYKCTQIQLNSGVMYMKEFPLMAVCINKDEDIWMYLTRTTS